MIVRSALLTALVLAAGPVDGVEWRVADLGRLDREGHCLAAAERSFTELLAEARIAALRRSDWVVYADGIESGGRHDALITCTFGDARGTRATLVVHATGPTRGLGPLARRISEIFAWHAGRITRRWKDSLR